MVGGTVIETIVLDDKVWINCRDNTYTKDDPTAIYVERNNDSVFIAPGDQVWWQGRWAMWTPTTGEFVERRIPRIGYSGVNRPVIAARHAPTVDPAGVRGRLRQATGETVSPSSWHRRPLKRRHEAQAVLLESLSRDTPSLTIFARRAAPDGTIYRRFWIGRPIAGPSRAAGGVE